MSFLTHNSSVVYLRMNILNPNFFIMKVNGDWVCQALKSLKKAPLNYGKSGPHDLFSKYSGAKQQIWARNRLKSKSLPAAHLWELQGEYFQTFCLFLNTKL